MKRLALIAVLFAAVTASADPRASAEAARRAVRAALEARTELPRHRPLLPTAQTELRVRRSIVPSSPAVIEQAKSKGAERAERARARAAERMETIRGRGVGPSAEERGAARNARQAKSKQVQKGGPPPGKGPGSKGNSDVLTPPGRGPKKDK